MTFQQLIRSAATKISQRDAETLLLYISGRSRAFLLSHPEAVLEPDLVSTFNSLVERRSRHEPLQYLTGVQDFFGLPFEVNPAVLIPRPETELLVEAVLHFVEQRSTLQTPTGLHIVDVGTGSGAIAVALASRKPLARVTALDLSEDALAVARRNASRHGAETISFLQSDLLQGLSGRAACYDVIVSNPPYVPLVDASSLQPEVREFEPALALFSGDDGLAVYRCLIPQAWPLLRPGGLLALEIGYGQQPALQELLEGWSGVRFFEDYAGIPRIALAERP